ncbi:GNAT family N-acetyltransferase [Cellulomonas triticagri]|uniref:GNAT family N-acetyltransferase n=1 Tax=Cellulomonas triticagri TaxID=2483352 RepID=A0A3M2JJY3_9CELL|nr:GNAT family N-acetyltransferase [Cellulomonas triticagri]RMI12441.1 GNAT family N-acetyltransferase [Cellulomonas triticagri]
MEIGPVGHRAREAWAFSAQLHGGAVDDEVWAMHRRGMCTATSLLARSAGAVVGTILAYPSAVVATKRDLVGTLLTGLAVAPCWRGRGLASLLVRTVTDACARDGGDVTFGWFGSRSLAERAGYGHAASYVGGRVAVVGGSTSHGPASLRVCPYVPGAGPVGGVGRDRWLAVPTEASESAQFFDYGGLSPLLLRVVRRAGARYPYAILSTSERRREDVIEVVRGGSPEARLDLIRETVRHLGVRRVGHLPRDEADALGGFEAEHAVELFVRVHSRRATSLVRLSPEVDLA